MLKRRVTRQWGNCSEGRNNLGSLSCYSFQAVGCVQSVISASREDGIASFNALPSPKSIVVEIVPFRERWLTGALFGLASFHILSAAGYSAPLGDHLNTERLPSKGLGFDKFEASLTALGFQIHVSERCDQHADRKNKTQHSSRHRNLHPELFGNSSPASAVRGIAASSSPTFSGLFSILIIVAVVLGE